VNRQLRLLDVPKSSYYYRPQRKIERVYRDEALKEEIIEMYKELPFYGNPRMTVELQNMGYKVNHKHVRRLRMELGLRTVYPRPRFNTSEPHPEHEKFPYLLRDVLVTRPNQAWATDITYTAVNGCRAFVIAIIDLFSRKALAYTVVNTMDTFHCIEVLNMALRRYGRPEIFNSDQGSQFTSSEFIAVLREHNIRISMDGKGRCLDNAKMERFWWALKYEDIKIKEYVSLPQLRLGVQSYVNFYNTRRIHSALEYKTPDEIYGKGCIRQSIVYIDTESLH
jgi:putative transposase